MSVKPELKQMLENHRTLLRVMADLWSKIPDTQDKEDCSIYMNRCYTAVNALREAEITLSKIDLDF